MKVWSVLLSIQRSRSSASSSPVLFSIAALSAQLSGIHSDLVERIGMAHERIDLIVECQARDIICVKDTLAMLSRRHNDFISDVNDFIRSIRRR